MKKLFTILAVAATLVSCAKEDVVREAEGEAIQFGNAFVENSTRVDPSYGTHNPLNTFKVWGTVNASNNTPVSIFADDIVSGSTVGEDSVWNCTTKTQYWINGATYNFAAVVGGEVTAENGLPKTIKYTADGQSDLLYARSKQYVGQASNNPKVAFEFKHLLSKIKFTLENTTSNETNVGVYTYTLTDVKIENAITTGTYTVDDTFNNTDKTYAIDMTAGAWTSTKADGMTFDSIEGVTNTTSKSSVDEKLIIPMNNATVTYNVNIYYGGKLITTTPGSASVNFAPGCAYNLTVSTGLNNPILFSVTEQPEWTTPATNVPLQ